MLYKVETGVSSIRTMVHPPVVLGDKLYVNLLTGKVMTKEYIRKKRIRKKDYAEIGTALSSNDDDNYTTVRVNI